MKKTIEKSFKKKLVVFSLSLSILSVSGCGLSKAEVGAGIGTVVGIAIGSTIGKGRGRMVAIAAGGILGGLLGKSIGGYLDAKDQQALMVSSARVLNKDDSSTGTWKSKRTGSTAKIKTSKSKFKKKRLKLVKHKKVKTNYKLNLIGKTYVATTSSKVRHKPAKTGEVITGLRKREKFTAVGVTSDNWILVAKNNITVGYIYADLAKPYKSKRSKVRSKAINLDDISSSDVAKANKAKKSSGGVNLDKVNLEQASISANTECKTVNMDIKSKKGSTSEKFEACKGSDGAWEII